MKKLVATLCQGEAHEKLGAITQPEMLRYARRIGAKFTVCNCEGWPKTIPMPWQKLMHLWMLLEDWDQILFLDNDALINADTCPDLFAMVPRTHIGAFKEGQICNRLPNLKRVADSNRLPIHNRNYNGDYVNTGVLLVSHLHRSIFQWPDVMQDDFYEQSYINARIFSNHIPIQELSYKFNRMSVQDNLTGEQRHGAHIIHYAGSYDYPRLELGMKEDLRRWREKVPVHTNIVFECTGGIGDVVYAEPVIRYIIEHTYRDRPDVTFHISTQRQRIFKHFHYPNVIVHHEPFEFDIRETPSVAIKVHPAGNHAVRALFPYQAVHNLDFQMHAMLGDYMPNSAKTVRLETSADEQASIRAKLGYKEEGTPFHQSTFATRLIAVHPGAGWASKTFPPGYWQQIVNELAEHATVVLFGKQLGISQGMFQGYVDVQCPKNGIDLREKLDLGEMFALIEACPKLLTNESAPLCIAGAFDNHIYLIANPKQPELVLPYRHGTVNYKTHAIRAKRLSSECLGILPNNPQKVTIAELPPGTDILDFLPDPDDVVISVLEDE